MLSIILSAALSATPETAWRPDMSPNTRSELISACLAGGSGNQIAARQCRRTISDALQQLYTDSSATASHANASPACLSAPSLSGAAMIDRVMLTVQLEEDIPERAGESPILTISAIALTLFPCGTRRF